MRIGSGYVKFYVGKWHGIGTVLFNADQAKLLGLEAGAPGLFIGRRGYFEDGRAIETTHSWYRGDAYDFVAELNTLP